MEWEGWDQGLGAPLVCPTASSFGTELRQGGKFFFSPAPQLPPQLPTPLSPDHMAQKGRFRASCSQPGLWFRSAGSREPGHVLTHVHCSLGPRAGEGENSGGEVLDEGKPRPLPPAWARLPLLSSPSLPALESLPPPAR